MAEEQKKQEQYAGEPNILERAGKKLEEGAKIFGMNIGGDKEVLEKSWVKSTMGTLDFATKALTLPGKGFLRGLTAMTYGNQVNEYMWAEKYMRRVEQGYQPMPVIGTIRKRYAEALVKRGFPNPIDTPVSPMAKLAWYTMPQFAR
jgi:hypothetical protein